MPAASMSFTNWGLTSYLCLCLSSTEVALPYNCSVGNFHVRKCLIKFVVLYSLTVDFSAVKMVSRFPSRIVPPICPWLCSGMSITTGYEVSGLISVELAFSQCKTFRTNSMVATCRPRQMPRNGFCVLRHHRQAWIMPSMPRFPNPPGTMTPL